MQDLKKCSVIAAIRDIDNVDKALAKPLKCLFMLTGDIFNIKYAVKHIQRANKRVFLHIDLLDGVSKDGTGLKYIASEIKPDGIITTRGHLINYAKSENLFTIQRVFLLDSLAVDTAIKTIRHVDPDALEILPAVIPKTIRRVHKRVNYPLIAGGLIEDEDDVQAALRAGALAVSVTNEEIWDKAFCRGLGD